MRWKLARQVFWKMALARSELPLAQLHAGDGILYYSPAFGFGDTRALRHSTVLRINAGAEYPLTLDTGEMLSRTTMIKLVAGSMTTPSNKRIWMGWRKLRTYTLHSGEVPGSTKAHQLCDSLARIVTESLAHIRSPQPHAAPLTETDPNDIVKPQPPSKPMRSKKGSRPGKMPRAQSTKASSRSSSKTSTTHAVLTSSSHVVLPAAVSKSTTVLSSAPAKKLRVRRVPGRPPGTYQYVPGGREYPYIDDSDAYSSYDEIVEDDDDEIVPETDDDEAPVRSEPPSASQSVSVPLPPSNHATHWCEDIELRSAMDAAGNSFLPDSMVSPSPAMEHSRGWLEWLQSDDEPPRADTGDDCWPPDVAFITANLNHAGIYFPSMDIGMCVCEEICDRASCLNALSKVWCSTDNCRATSCSNKLSESRTVKLVYTPTGLCVQATAFMECGEVVGEYLGELTVLVERAAASRYAFQIRKRSVDNRVVYIDASLCGGISRHVNHSCAPNCSFEQFEYLAEVRVAVVTTRQIAPGEQLTARYNIGDLKFDCQCGERSCISTS